MAFLKKKKRFVVPLSLNHSSMVNFNRRNFHDGTGMGSLCSSFRRRGIDSNDGAVLTVMRGR